MLDINPGLILWTIITFITPAFHSRQSGMEAAGERFAGAGTKYSRRSA